MRRKACRIDKLLPSTLPTAPHKVLAVIVDRVHICNFQKDEYEYDVKWTQHLQDRHVDVSYSGRQAKPPGYHFLASQWCRTVTDSLVNIPI